MEYAALDLETTGLDPDRDGVIEVGAVAFNHHVVVDRLELLANPGRKLPDAVARLTGIKNEELRGAPPSQQALETLSRFLEGGQSQPALAGGGAGARAATAASRAR